MNDDWGRREPDWQAAGAGRNGVARHCEISFAPGLLVEMDRSDYAPASCPVSTMSIAARDAHAYRGSARRVSRARGGFLDESRVGYSGDQGGGIGR
jgi:hypothetical protein